MKKVSVSVGIPAYNEEANISSLLKALVSQNHASFEVIEILVVSDGSTDATDSIVTDFPDKRVKLIRNKKRCGQALTQNVILKECKGDVLVLLNADTLIADDYIFQIVDAYKTAPPLTGIIGSRVVPVPSTTFFGKVINYSHLWKEHMYTSISSDSDNVYLCHGRGRAFTKAFAKQFTWPELTTEDAYSYLSCKQQGFVFVYALKAEVYFNSPQTLADHIKQSKRFFGGQNELSRFFDKSTVEEAFSIPKQVIAAAMLKYFILNPVLFTLYLVLLVYIKKTTIPELKSAVWESSVTSKNSVSSV